MARLLAFTFLALSFGRGAGAFLRERSDGGVARGATRGVVTGVVRDPADDDWKASVKEAEEVSELSDQIYAAQADLQKARNDYSYYKKHYSDKKALLKEQIEIRKSQLDTHPSADDAEFQASEEERYKNMMCYKVMDAFVFNDDNQEKRLHILEICMGRVSLALLQARPQPQPHLADGPLPGNGSAVWLAHFSIRVQKLGDRIHALEDAAQRLGGPKEMQDMLSQLEAEEAAVKSELAADKAKWSKECDELAEEEQALGNEHVDNYHNRQAIKEAAAQKAKDDFCPVVQSNYRYDEDKIREHAASECR